MKVFIHVCTFYFAGSDLLIVSVHTAVSEVILICQAPAEVVTVNETWLKLTSSVDLSPACPLTSWRNSLQCFKTCCVVQNTVYVCSEL